MRLDLRDEPDLDANHVLRAIRDNRLQVVVTAAQASQIYTEVSTVEWYDRSARMKTDSPGFWWRGVEIVVE